MGSPRRRVVLSLLAVGAVAGGLAVFQHRREIHCEVSEQSPAQGSTRSWDLSCDDGAQLVVQLPQDRDGRAELQFERGPEGLQLPALRSALSLSLAGSRTSPFQLGALERVEGTLRVETCDQDRFQEKARSLPPFPEAEIENSERQAPLGEGIWPRFWSCQRQVDLPRLRSAGELTVSSEVVARLEAPRLESLGALKLEAPWLERVAVPLLSGVNELEIEYARLDQCTAEALVATVKPGGRKSVSAAFTPCNRARPPEASREALAAEEQARRDAGLDCPPGMALVEGGLIARDGGPDERISDFCLDVTEVTVSSYAAGGGVLPSKLEGQDPDLCSPAVQVEPHHPVGCVTFGEAEAFCARAGRRLPTAPEWRWAAHSGPRATTFPWGDEAPRHRACMERRLSALHYRGPADAAEAGACPVGSFPEGRSAQGVYDLLGNVAEWATAPGDPFLLGGGYTAAAPELRAEEQVNGARYHLPTIGFRCAASRGAHGR